MEVNDILKDESKNDRDLIKELSVYVKHHRDSQLPINRAFVKGAVDIILKNSEVNYKGINFDYPDGLAAWGLYDDDKLDFNITGLVGEAEYLKKGELKSKEGDNRIFKYYYILSSAVHEITHARQDYLNKEYGNEIYNSGFEFLREYYIVYSLYHDDMLFERYANLRGDKITYETLSYVYPKEQIHELRKTMFTYLLSGYYINQDNMIFPAGYEWYLSDDAEVICALARYNELLELWSNNAKAVEIEADENMSLFNRLYLGLPITLEEYSKIKETYLNNVEGCENKDSSMKELIDEVERELKKSKKKTRKLSKKKTQKNQSLD